MALTATSFIEPAGELSEELFPGKDLEEFTTAWLAEAVTKTSSEAAQAAWVYYRAYLTVANRMNAEASSERKGDVTAARVADQLAYWRKLAAEHRQEFDSLTGAAVGGAFLQPIGYTSTEVE